MTQAKAEQGLGWPGAAVPPADGAAAVPPADGSEHPVRSTSPLGWPAPEPFAPSPADAPDAVGDEAASGGDAPESESGGETDDQTFTEAGPPPAGLIAAVSPASPAPEAAPTPAPRLTRESLVREALAQATALAADVSRETPAPAVSRETPTSSAGEVSRETSPLDLPADTPIAAAAAAAVRLRDSSERFPSPATRRIVTIANQKGGVGKTTTTVNLATALALRGLRVLCIDLDPQGNASTGLGIEHQSGTPSIYEVLLGEMSLRDVVQAAAIPGLYCAPATIDLAGAEIELVSVVARETRLRRAIDAYDEPLDYVLIDCPPSLGLLTVNALVAAREMLIPIQCEYYALEGLGQLLRNVELIRSHLNNDLAVSTILLTMYDARTRLAEQVADEVRNHFGPLVLGTTIPRSVRISEAPGYGQSVLTYDPASRGAIAYLAAAREFAERGAQPGTEETR